MEGQKKNITVNSKVAYSLNTKSYLVDTTKCRETIGSQLTKFLLSYFDLRNKFFTL